MCIGETIDKLPGATKQPLRNSSVGSFIPTLGGSLDPHYFRTNSQAEERHKKVGVHQEAPPPPPPLPDRPQGARQADTTPLRRRNGANGVALPGGSTMLTGPSGVTNAQLNLGASSLLGGP